MRLEFELMVRDGRSVRAIFRGDLKEAEARAFVQLAAGEWVRLVPKISADSEIPDEEV